MNTNAGSNKWFDKRAFKIQGHACTEEDLMAMIDFCLAIKGMGYGKHMESLIEDFESTVDIYRLMAVLAKHKGNDTKVHI